MPRVTLAVPAGVPGSTKATTARRGGVVLMSISSAP